MVSKNVDFVIVSFTSSFVFLYICLWASCLLIINPCSAYLSTCNNNSKKDKNMGAETNANKRFAFIPTYYTNKINSVGCQVPRAK